MSLTGWALPTLLILLALVLVVPIVLGLPTNRGLKPALVRVGQLTGFTILVLTLTGVILNNQEKFFATWSDLGQYVFETTPDSETSSHGGVAPSRSPEPASPSVQPIPALPPLPSSDKIQAFTVTGGKSGLTGKITVVLPDNYNPKAATGYPVLVAFMGYPGDERQWLASSTMNLPQTLAQAVAAKKIADPIVVIPQITFEGLDSECVNGPSGRPQVGTWLSQDVIDWTIDHLRVGPVKTHWATTGFSAGGYCSAYIGLHDPHRFGAAQILGGYFKPLFSGGYRPLTDAQLTTPEYDLTQLVQTQPPAMAVWVQSARGDGLSHPSSAAFLKAVKAPTAATEVTLEGGGHTYRVWRASLAESFEWLAATLPGFAAAH